MLYHQNRREIGEVSEAAPLCLEMAGGSLAPAGVAKERAEQYQGKLTAYVIVACIVAAVGGSLFGYDIGISGNLFISSPHPPTCFFGKLFSLDSGLFFWL